MELKKTGLKEGFDFLTDIQDDFTEALSDGKITRMEALHLFSIVLKHAVHFGIALLASGVNDG